MLKIGIVTTSIRKGRAGLGVAQWVLDNAIKKGDKDVRYELIDLKDYQLPFMGQTPTDEQTAAINKWSEKINEMDGYIFVMAEYNHSLTGVFKNATDFLQKEFHHKAAAYVGYGGVGGARAIEAHRLIAAEMHLATSRKTVNFLLAVDFENYSVFKPLPHQAGALNVLLDDLLPWVKAFKGLRQ
ncbi:MAG: NAD(P)H-dependent oxidoreductase [Acholeplasmataceae bacterium]